MRPMVPIEPYWQRVRRLRQARGLSQTRLYRLTEDVSMDMIRALESDPGRESSAQRHRSRYPSATTLARVAKALDVAPEEFPEYRLAVARDRLDDRVVGLERAVASLEAIERQLLN
jgi:transcriptional regulator with XRE-family HTH domain